MLPRTYLYFRHVEDGLRSSDDLRVFQERLLGQTVSEAAETEFYREKWLGSEFDPGDFSSIEDLESIPPVTQDEKDSIPGVEDRPGDQPGSDYMVSSGSSGSPAGIKYSSQAYDWLSGVHMKRLFERGYRTGMPQVRYRAQPLERGLFEDLLFPQERIDPGLDFESQIEEIEKMRGGFLFYFSNVLFTLAKKIERREKGFRGEIDGIVAHGEIITDEMRDTVSEVFGAPVYAHYGAAELHTVGWGCPDSRGYHIDNESVAVEILDTGDSTGEEKAGEIVATSLVRTLSPVIRYRTGDVGQIKEEGCSCSADSRRIELKGRKSNTFMNREGKRIYPKQVVEILSEFHDLLLYRLEIRESGALLKYVPNDGFNPSEVVKAQESLESRLDLEVQPREVEELSMTPGGKIPPVRNFRDQ